MGPRYASRWRSGARLRALAVGGLTAAAAASCGDDGVTAPAAIDRPIVYVTAGRIHATDTTATDEVVIVDEQTEVLALWAQWSPRGDHLLTLERDRAPGPSTEVFVRASDGSGRVRVSAAGRSPDSYPEWSPDGTRITYTDRQLFVVNRDGSDHAPVNADSTSAIHPHWSPTGEWIVYFGSLPGGESGIVRVRPDGSGRELLRVLGFDDDQRPRVSPDGRRIVFLEDRDLYVMDIDGSNVERLTFTPAEGDWWPRWSPDGRLLAFHTDAGSDWGIAVLEMATGQITDLFSDQFEITHPSWAPDSRRLTFDVEFGMGIGALGSGGDWVGFGMGDWPSWHPGR